MAETVKTRSKTAICGYDAESVRIRGKDLVNEVMGHYSFPELMILQSLGREPSRTEAAIVDAVLVTIMEHGLVPSAVATRLTTTGHPSRSRAPSSPACSASATATPARRENAVRFSSESSPPTPTSGNRPQSRK